MAAGSNCENGFGYPLHLDEHRGAPVPLDGVPTVTDTASKWFKADSDAPLPKFVEEELRARRLAKKLNSSGGNQEADQSDED